MTAKERFERLARAAASRPFLTLGVVLALALGGGVLALGLRPDASSSTFVSSSSSSYKATNDDHQHFGADAVIVLVREKLTNLVETKDLAVLSQLEACLGGQVLNASTQLASFTPAKPGSKPPYGGYGSPCGKLMKAKPVQAVYGPGTFLNRAVSAVTTGVLSLLNGARSAVSSAETAAYKLAIGKGMSRAQAQKLATAAGTLKQQQEYAEPRAAVPQLGHLGHPLDRQRPVHLPDRVRPDAGRQPAQGAVLLPVPDGQLGADPDSAQGRTQRPAATQRDQVDPPGGCDADVPAGRWRHLHRQRRAGGDQRPRFGDHRLDRGPARCGGARDGGDASDRVPQPVASASARRGTGGGGDHVRCDVAAGCDADDGLDRGAADPDRTGGRLRDPVPVARAGVPPGGL